MAVLSHELGHALVQELLPWQHWYLRGQVDSVVDELAAWDAAEVVNRALPLGYRSVDQRQWNAVRTEMIARAVFEGGPLPTLALLSDFRRAIVEEAGKIVAGRLEVIPLE